MDFQTGQGAGALEQPKGARPAPSLPETPVALIDADEGTAFELRDLWIYRELLYFLTWRDIKVRYKQTFMGAAWVIIQPLASMLLFTLFFNRFAGLQSGDVPYPLFAYTGLLLWTFFANAVINSTNSLISNTNLITKVYFPRVFITAAAVGAGLVDLAIASIILVGLGVYYGVALSWQLLLLPLFVALALMLSLGVGMLVSSLTVKYRDLKHALPFLMQFWMFASPIIYPSSIVPEGWRWLLVVNPLAPVIEGFRAALLGRAIAWPQVLVAAAVALGLLVFSAYIFRRMEESFADLV